VLAGKWAGAVGAMMIPIAAVSLAGVGIIASASERPPSTDVVVSFLVYTFLLISVFALLQMLFSTLAKTTGTAVLSGIGLWLFFFLLFDVILLVVDNFTPLSDDMRAGAAFFNPVTLYALTISGAVSGELPYGLATWSPGLGLFVWLVVMAVVASEVFRRRATE
jgi:ABC-type transport system involved in multi-copper enzyme maturation permease subunit